MYKLLLVVVCVGVLCGAAFAIDQLDAYPQPPGLHWNYYPHFYTADKMKDHNGDTALDGINMQLTEAMIRPVYIQKDWIFNAIVPVGEVKMTLPEVGTESSSGVGDIQIGVGKYQHMAGGNWTWLPHVMVKLANGPFEKDQMVNYGSGQVSVALENYFIHCGHDWQLDGVVRYKLELKNHDTGVTPGDQFGAEVMISRGSKVPFLAWRKDLYGLAVEYMTSLKDKDDDGSIPDSQVTKLTIGPELYHGINPRCHFWMGVKWDVVSKNAPRGTLIWFKYTCF